MTDFYKEKWERLTYSLMFLTALAIGIIVGIFFSYLFSLNGYNYGSINNRCYGNYTCNDNLVCYRGKCIDECKDEFGCGIKMSK